MPVLSWKRRAVFLRLAFGHEKGAAAETCSRCAQRIYQPLSEALGWHPSEHPPVPLARQLAHNAGTEFPCRRCCVLWARKGKKQERRKVVLSAIQRGSSLAKWALLIKTFPEVVYLSKHTATPRCFDFCFCAQEGGEKRVLLSESFSKTPDDG